MSNLEGDKSATQKVSDSTSSGSKDVEGESKSYLQSAQEGAGNIATSVSDTLSGKIPSIFQSLLCADRTLTSQTWLIRSPAQATRSRLDSMIP